MRARIGLALGLVSTLSLSSYAAIVNVGGQGDLLIAGPGVGYTPDFFNDTTLVVHGWDEVRNYTLLGNLDVDITTYGTFTTFGSVTPGTIASGTVISSHTLNFDPLGGGAQAGFQFDGTIIGVIVIDALTTTDLFIDSDFLIPAGVPSGNIPLAHYDHRGIELTGSTDSITVTANSVFVSLNAGSPGDQIRVITAAVPEPCTLVAGAASLLGFLRMKRRQRVQS